MLDPQLAEQLKGHLTRIVQPIVLATSLDDGAKSVELATLLDEIAAMSDKITVVRRDDDERRPSFAIERTGTDVSVRFAGIPMGHEFTSLVLALLRSAATLRRPTRTRSSRSATSMATTTSRPTSPSPARTAPMWSRA